jgi:O-antigen ligase
MPNSFLFGAGAYALLAALLLGGGARAGLLSDGVLELLCLPVLLIAAWRWLDLPAERRPRVVLFFLLAVAALFALQLAPLPPWLWTRLPEREPLAAAFALIGRPLPFAPISVDPHATRAALLAAIPPLTLFLVASCLRREERWRLLLLSAIFAAASVALGLLQLAQGPESALRFYRPTNEADAVGFFANRNHFAALLYCGLVVACVYTIEVVRRARSVRAILEDTRMFVAALAGGAIVLILMAGEAMTRSRAGIALALAAVAGALAIGYDRRAGGSDPIARKRGRWIALGALALTLVLQVPLYRAMERLNTGVLDDARWTIARRAFATAVAYLPAGSGVGSFVPAYASHEKPEELVADAYVNHAHDDFLELFLETGVLGVALLAGFLLWWGRRSLRAWRPAPGVSRADPYVRAATLIVGLLMIHSIVDYPLRSAAMMGVFALACAILAAPEEAVLADEASPTKAPSRKRRRSVPPLSAPLRFAPAVPAARRDASPGARVARAMENQLTAVFLRRVGSS